MGMKEFNKKWFNFVNKMNTHGIPLPMVKDPHTGRGSITASLLAFSAFLFGFCIMFMLATAIAKLTGIFILNETSISQVRTAADYSFQFLLAALGGYWGRKFQKDDKDKGPDEDSIPDRSGRPERRSRVDDPDC